jgi:general secretion pathway protein B
VSYILEALKKIEQKRVEERSPESLTLLGEPESGPKKWPRWIYPVLAALLLNFGALVWWIGPWKAEKKAPSVRPYAVQPTALAPPILGVQNRSGRSEDKKKALRKKSVPKIPVEVSKTVQPATPVQPLLAGQTRPIEAGGKKEELREKTVPKISAEVTKKGIQDVPVAMSGKPQTALQNHEEKQPHLKKEPAPGNKVYDFNDLPPSVKSALPEIKVSVHMYNPDPQSRLVRINDRSLKEGQELSPGLKVEEIIPGGIVFSFQGYRFRFKL